MNIAICGLGVVGSAVYNSFKKRNIHVIGYDKYKSNGIGSPKDMLQTDMVFLCLPTPYKDELKEYDKSSIHDVCSFLIEEKYKGIVVLKSTVEPGTCRSYSKNLTIVHNPEFLTASTAEKDFDQQSHIVLGGSSPDAKEVTKVETFYRTYWRDDPEYSTCVWEESEMMKLGVNCFYSTKIQYFNELYLLSKVFQIDYDKVVSLMLKNGWISPHHVKVPGTDGKLSYGGMCFPKDTNALLQTMIRKKSKHKVLEAVVKERNEMRDD